MSRKNYYTTTAFVATLTLGFPQVVPAQNTSVDTGSATTGDTGAQVEASAPGSEGSGTPATDHNMSDESDVEAEVAPETSGTDAEAMVETNDEATPGVAADVDTGSATTGDAGAQVEANAPGSEGSGTPATDHDMSDESDVEAEVAPETSETDAEAMVETNDEATPEVAADVDTGSSVTEDDSAQVALNELVAAASAGSGAEPIEVTDGTIGTGGARTSNQEFDTQIDGSIAVAGEETRVSTDTTSAADGGMSRFDESLMLGLGAVAVGALLDDGSEVVANTGDRVVVNRDGQLVVYKDDNALLFREGANVRTETFSDGSTKALVTGADGGQIVTIRDGEGRVLRRTQVTMDGAEVQLFDDTIQAEAIDAAQLANYVGVDSIIFSNADQAALRAALQADVRPDRRFSLRQIREHEEVRNLVPSIDLDTINFATGSSALLEGQVDDLRGIGTTMEEVLIATPQEVFLIEGYTDAVGDEVSNLALSDRRAETIALALTENFGIAPENLLVQGYGEQFLKLETQDAELANRRATVRRITPLLQQASAE